MEKKRFIFDIDGTLLIPDWNYEELYFSSVLKKLDFEVFYPQIPKLLEEYEKKFPRYDVVELSRFLTMKSGVLITPEIIIGWNKALGETKPEIIEGVVESLEYLKSKDKSLVALTNWFLGPQIERLKSSGLDSYFDFVYGGELGIKPSEVAYMNAIGEFDIDSSIMIGDSLDFDVYGPGRIGMDAIFYNPKNKDYDKAKVKSIGSMKKIKEMF